MTRENQSQSPLPDHLSLVDGLGYTTFALGGVSLVTEALGQLTGHTLLQDVSSVAIAGTFAAGAATGILYTHNRRG